MKAITLTQPWASLVAIGAKRIETRSWSTPYRGTLLIHAGKGLGPVGGQRGLVEICQSEPFASVLAMHGMAWGNLVLRSQLPLGAIVAVAELVDVATTDKILNFRTAGGLGYGAPGGRTFRYDLTEQERAFGDYSPGRYGWLLAGVQRLANPVPCKGALSLWTPPAEVIAAVAEQVQL